MAGINERWDAQQRSRWMRPDAARYLRPDIERYFTPAAWQAMTPAQRGQLSGAEVERKGRVVAERSIADLQRERSWLARQKLELLELYDLHLRLKALNPSQRSDHYLYQPRIPKHNEGGGRWTRDGGENGSDGRIQVAASYRDPRDPLGLNKRSPELIGGGGLGPPASSFHGSGTTPLKAVKGPPRNRPETINGVPYSGHAFDQMQNRGIFLSVVEHVLRNGLKRAGKGPNTTRYYDPINNISVIRNDRTGNIITLRGGDR